jgi:penicillin amidase
VLSLQTLNGLSRLVARLALNHGVVRRRRTLSTAERLCQLPRHGLPLKQPVGMHWHERQIPFIEAADDRDLAVALGLVHGHLRLTQIEIMRRLAQGRLAEILGAAALPVDRAMRIVGFTRAVPEIDARLPAGSRAWLEGFVDGINAVIAGPAGGPAPERPEEFRLLGIEPAPWTLADVLAVGRLAASDFTWKVWQKLIRLTGREDWDIIWERLITDNATAMPRFSGQGTAPGDPVDDLDFETLVDRAGRNGSNCFAVSAARSATGGAILASDPHLGLMLPNVWLVAGFKSPGFHAVGMMIPGLPVVALGRNAAIGWGGTSLHAGSSDLVDLSDLPPASITSRQETIRVRWGRPETVTIRETAHGPVITDIPRFASSGKGPLALTWIGHRPTDEVTAMLGLLQASDFDSFVTALDGFAAPGQTMIYADATGRIGSALAAHLPRRPHNPPADLAVPPEATQHWERVVTARDLPHAIDPPDGVLASANNRPAGTVVPVGFFFSADERVNRIRTLLRAKERLSVPDMAAIQLDVVMPSSLGLARQLADLAGEGLPAAPDGKIAAGEMLQALRDWDGAHRAESAGALAFELMVYYFLHRLHGEAEIDVFRATWDPWSLLHRDLATLDRPRLARAAGEAAGPAAHRFARFGSWGAMHRLRLAHPFGSVPVIGRRYRFAEEPVAGSNETVMKTSHGFHQGRHGARLGVGARHISDFANMDRNFFVLLGGQDGWLGSATFCDQLDLWRRGEFVQVPLRPETAHARFPHHMTLHPAEARVAEPAGSASGQSAPD